LETSEKTEQMAINYQKLLNIPEDAKIDCFHLAVCVETNMDYLLSWNCTHLGIPSYQKLFAYNQKHGLPTPFLITPETLNTKEMIL
jgi:predicted nucleic acid-binding protein